MSAEVARRLEAFGPVSPELLRARQLLKRVDRKFLFSRQLVPELLDALQCGYGLLRAGDETMARYETLYFDTEGLDAFHDHRRGRRPRYKARVRHYADREVSFLEVKCKGSQGRTDKSRVQRPFGESELTAADEPFITEHLPARLRALGPVLWTHFKRVTLVGVDTEERITFDWDLCFEARGQVHTLGQVVIGEIKQARLAHRTPAMLACRRLRIRPASASKYCLGVAELGLSDRTSALRPTQKAIRRMS